MLKKSKSPKAKTDEEEPQDIFLNESINILADYIKLTKPSNNTTVKI